MDLGELEAGVEEATGMEEDDAENLDGILATNGVPYEDALHDFGEDEDHEVDGDTLGGAIVEGGSRGKVMEEDGLDGDDDGGLCQGKKKGNALKGGFPQERGHWGWRPRKRREGGREGEEEGGGEEREER